jgi:uncharacterized membrane protein YphA (DoxX/SURF4 family)
MGANNTIAFFFISFCRVSTGLVFALSAVGKLSSLDNFAQTISSFQLIPRQLSRFLAFALWICEFTVVSLMIIGGDYLLWGFLLATLLLIIFSAAIAITVRRGLQTSCNCFGKNDDKQLSVWNIVRNIGFIVCTFGGAIVYFTIDHRGNALELSHWVLLSFMAVVFVGILLNLSDLTQLLRAAT